MCKFSQLGSITDIHRGTTWSPQEFAYQISHRLNKLSALGIKQKSHVVIAHGNTPEFFADLFACWSLGACCICTNPALTKGELQTVVDFVEAVAVLVSHKHPASTDNLTIPVIDTGEGTETAATLPEALWPDINNPALILFTSGTTGNPKGVVHSCASLAARIKHNRQYISDEILQRSLCVLPTHFGHGLIGNCLTPLLSSAHLFLFPNPGIQGTAQIGEILCDNKITFMSSVPAFWKMALKVARPPEELCLKQINIGSAPLSAELWQQVIAWSNNDNVCNMYGITETANWAAGISSRVVEPEDGLVGSMWGGSAAVLDKNNIAQQSGAGEIILQTPSLMTGYYHRDDLTAQVLKDGWYHTGDHGSIDEHGIIRLLGRIKTEINRAGTKVLPEEVDMLLENHPNIIEACSFGLPDPINGETVAVAIRCTDNDVTAEQMRHWCSERIRRECIPEKWFIVDDIPKSDRGKINRNTVRDMCIKKDRP